MKDWMCKLIAFLFVLVVFVLSIIFAAWFFNLVMASGLPDWAKYLILRR